MQAYARPVASPDVAAAWPVAAHPARLSATSVVERQRLLWPPPTGTDSFAQAAPSRAWRRIASGPGPVDSRSLTARSRSPSIANVGVPSSLGTAKHTVRCIDGVLRRKVDRQMRLQPQLEQVPMASEGTSLRRFFVPHRPQISAKGGC